MKNSFAVLSVAVAFSMSLVAKEVTWTGGGSGWVDPDNWSDTPQEGDIAVIPENATATVKPADVTVFRAFGGYRLEAGSTLFLDAVSFFSYSAFDKPLTGSGTLLAVGGSLYLKSDNSAFDGKFAFTNNYVEVHSTSALGTTNEVWVNVQGTSNGKQIKIDRVEGPGVMSNAFYFAGNSAPAAKDQQGSRYNVLESIKSPLRICGPVTILNNVWGKFINDASSKDYYTRYCGGIYGKGWMFGGAQNVDSAMQIEAEVDLEGGLVACDGNFDVRAKIKRGDLDVDSPDRTIRFFAADLCPTNSDFNFGRVKISAAPNWGGTFDLNGFDQETGNLVTWREGMYEAPNCVITSPSNATLTVRGCAARTRDTGTIFNSFPGVLKGAVSLCLDWDGRPGLKPLYTVNEAGVVKLTCSGSTTTGGLSCKAGLLTVEATATLPNLTALGVSNAGKMTVSANGIGEEGDGLVVTVADSGVLTIAEGVTLAAKSACIGGKWIDPKPGETYGGPDSAATVKLAGLAGTGILTVAEYGGPKGLMMILR